MSEYTIVRVQDGFVVEVFGKGVLKLASRRCAARLICTICDSQQDARSCAICKESALPRRSDERVVPYHRTRNPAVPL